MRLVIAAAGVFISVVPAFSDIEAGLDALVRGDAELASSEFQSAFEGGDADGAFYLGRMLELGMGAMSDPAQAAAIYAIAVEQGSTLAANRLGLMYLEGQGVIRDYRRGAELLCDAADEGDAAAQFNCGVVHADGKGVAQDDEKALEYWRLSSEQGNIGATNLIAIRLKESDPEAAFALFQQTAAQGNAIGLYEMAVAYETGNAISADLVEAYGYANLAASQSHPEAAALRDRLEAEMSAEQVAQGQERTRAILAEIEAGPAPGDEAEPTLADN
ncbi:MAG: tetratricopeptide repeat protein [Paracoccus sp. (in: a-proteobacteria)]|nr:tetratricopeptide repeat protein [Paracoccus sp. (in: a-proteobacteria)]